MTPANHAHPKYNSGPGTGPEIGTNSTPRSTIKKSAKGAKATNTQLFYDQLEFSIPRLKLALVSEKLTLRPWPKIASAHDAAKLLKPLRYAAEEHFVSLHLNAKFEVIGLHEVSHGTLSASLVHPREVFKAALVANSYAILVCHNHPSGASLSPSREDFDTTNQLIEAGKFLGVTLVDHVIIGLENRRAEITSQSEGEHIYSFREVHPELWSN